MRIRRKLVFIAVFTLLIAGALVSAASAAHVTCGAVITQNTTLDSDVGPCPNFGITIAADNVTLNLNGHTVFGTPLPGDGAGILLDGVSGVRVTNGTVHNFDGGVVIEGGGGNTVSEVVARDNIGFSAGHPPSPGTSYGDGIAIAGSSNNRVIDSVARNNGPFSGIALYEVPDPDHPGFPPAPVTGNQVLRNLVEDNVACREGPFCDNDGIRLEPQVGPDNVVRENIVRRNGLDGISLFGFATQNIVTRNLVEDNGFRGAVRGDGIRVFGFDNLIHKNSSFRNANDGISVGRRNFTQPPGPFTHRSFPPPNGMNNRILLNDTGANLRLDLWDSNPNCDQNVWRNNTYSSPVKAQPPCTRLPHGGRA